VLGWAKLGLPVEGVIEQLQQAVVREAAGMNERGVRQIRRWGPKLGLSVRGIFKPV
jgi:hypothetical protein